MPDKYDPDFILSAQMPDPLAALNLVRPNLKSVLRDCVFVLDANTLLIPYETGKNGFAEIRRVFQKLQKVGRLVVPGQSVREFIKNRPSKLARVFENLGTRPKHPDINLQHLPFLESEPVHEKVQEIEKQISKLQNDYRKATKDLVEQIAGWEWTDVVVDLYRELLSETGVIVDVLVNDEISKEFRNRVAAQIPPGYKDGKKGTNAAGDFLIWKTIMQVGAKRKKHIVFVSGEKKSDWWERHDPPLKFVRHELILEFASETSGKAFYIVELAELLDHFKASQEVVDEVKAAEEAQVAQNDFQPDGKLPHEREWERAEDAVFSWLRDRFPKYSVARTHNEPWDATVTHPSESSPRLGIQVKLARPGGPPIGLMQSLLGRARQAGVFERFELVFVFPSADCAMEGSEQKLATLQGLSGASVIFGTIGVDGSFVPVNRFHVLSTAQHSGIKTSHPARICSSCVRHNNHDTWSRKSKPN